MPITTSSWQNRTLDFTTMMALEPHGPDTFVGTGPEYPWGGLYGGQIVAQALPHGRARCRTARFLPHSLHAYFIRAGNATEPIRFEVDRDRDGRSFCTRRVVVRQSTGVILNMAASFHIVEDAPFAQAITMPDVGAPETLASPSWSALFERRFVKTTGSPTGRATAWLRLHDKVADDPRSCKPADWRTCPMTLPTDAVFTVHALGELYAFYGRTEPMLENLLRDEKTMPVVQERFAAFHDYLEAARERLLAGRSLRGAAEEGRVQRWGMQSRAQPGSRRVREQQLGDDDAVALMIAVVAAAG